MINNVARAGLSSTQTYVDTEHYHLHSILNIKSKSLSPCEEIIESDLGRAKNVDWT